MKFSDVAKILCSTFLVFYLAGCVTSPNLVPTIASSEMLEIQSTSIPSLPEPPNQQIPSAKPLPESQPSPTSEPVSYVPTQAVFTPCSPLKDIPLQELPEIISAPYAPPPMGKDDRHQGVDFSFYRRSERESIQGLEIQAVLPGQVAAAIHNSFPFGNLVIVETPAADLPIELRQHYAIGEKDSLYLLYAHMEKAPELEFGDIVQTCQILGQVGKSGNAGIAHLHLEVRRGPAGQRFTAIGYYQADTSPEERQNYLLWRTSGVFQHYDPMDLLRFPAK